MQVRVVLILILSFALPALAQEQIPKGPPWNQMCEEFSGNGIRPIFASDACQEEFLDVYHRLSREKDIHTWMLEHRSCLHEWAHFSWLAVFMNEEKMSRLAWYHQMYLAKSRFLGGNSCDGDSCNADAVRAALQIGLTTEVDQAAIDHTNEFLDKVKQDTAFKDKMDKAYRAVDAICLYHGNFECKAAMKSALDWMYPHSYKLGSIPEETITFSMIETTRSVFTDTKIQKYASRFALELMKQIENRNTHLSESFYEMGLKAFDGDAERFWRFIVVYATRGSAWATGYPMVAEKNKSTFMALMVISSAMSVFDFHFGVHGEGWSYGNIATNTCYQPKPYHYWMTAGFSYFLTKSGYSVATAKLVARLMGALYEVGSTTVGRVPDEVYFVPTFHSKVNRARREITHHFLGAEFGTRPDPSTYMAFDQNISEFLQASRPLPDISDEEMTQKIKDPMTRWQYWTRLTGFYLSSKIHK
jgi:hypothetical protein